MLITDQVSTYLHIYIYRECLHKQSVRASALQIANQNCQLKVRALLSLEKMSIFNPISGIFLLVSKVQCTVEKCTVRMKVKITLYSTAAASGGGCSAGAAHQSRAQSTSVLRPAHLSSLFTPDSGMNAILRRVSRAAADHISCLQMMISCSSLWTWMTILVTRFCPTTETRSSWSVSEHP